MHRNTQDQSSSNEDENEGKESTKLIIEELSRLEMGILKKQAKIADLERLKNDINQIFDEAEQEINNMHNKKPKDPYPYYYGVTYQPKPKPLQDLPKKASEEIETNKSYTSKGSSK